MSKICELHDTAMDIMNEGIALQEHGNSYDACAKFLYACELESESAYLVDKNSESEPSRGMLFLGAASLAFRAKDYEQAERLACEGLSGYPTEKVRMELRKIHDEIKFEQAARKTAPILENAETVIRFWDGSSVGHGYISAKTLMQRLDALDRIVNRTVQRLAGLPFEGHPKKHPDLPQYQLGIEWAEAGSFGMKVRLTQKLNQSISLLTPPPSKILKDIIDNIRLVSNGEENIVKQQFDNDDYSTHFISQAKEFLPDGEHVKNIGFINNSENDSFTIKRTKKEVNSSLQENKLTDIGQQQNNKTDTINNYRGYLRISDGVDGFFSLIQDNDNTTPIKIYVREALEELVKKYFGDLVEVTCTKKGRKLYLDDITPVTET